VGKRIFARWNDSSRQSMHIYDSLFSIDGIGNIFRNFRQVRGKPEDMSRELGSGLHKIIIHKFGLERIAFASLEQNDGDS
jgi:hypothetical protein